MRKILYSVLLLAIVFLVSACGPNEAAGTNNEKDSYTYTSTSQTTDSINQDNNRFDEIMDTEYIKGVENHNFELIKVYNDGDMVEVTAEGPAVNGGTRGLMVTVYDGVMSASIYARYVSSIYQVAITEIQKIDIEGVDIESDKDFTFLDKYIDQIGELVASFDYGEGIGTSEEEFSGIVRIVYDDGIFNAIIETYGSSSGAVQVEIFNECLRIISDDDYVDILRDDHTARDSRGNIIAQGREYDGRQENPLLQGSTIFELEDSALVAEAIRSLDEVYRDKRDSPF